MAEKERKIVGLGLMDPRWIWVSEDVENLENGTIAKGAIPSVQPELPGTHPAKSVTTWYERCTFLPSHTHAAHRIIPLSSFLRCCCFHLRFLQQPHQRHSQRRLPLRFPWSPKLPLRRQRRREIHPRARWTRTHAFGYQRVRILTLLDLLLLLMLLYSSCSFFSSSFFVMVLADGTEDPGGTAAAHSGESEAFFEGAPPPVSCIAGVDLFG